MYISRIDVVVVAQSQKLSYAWFVQKKIYIFFKNQVNDECKVGHFADTYKYRGALERVHIRLYSRVAFSNTNRGKKTAKTNKHTRQKITWLTVFACFYLFLI